MKKLREGNIVSNMLEATNFLTASGDVGVLHTKEGVSVTA